MKTETFHLELITPCFCAGADQAKAEVRAPSIRGQLRWWFRVLGGSAIEEKEVFGGVHKLAGERKEDSARASSVVVRLSDVVRANPWEPFRMKADTPGAYIWYFASVSAGKKRWWRTPPSGEQHGQPNPDGNLPPGTKFKLHIAVRRPMDPQLEKKFQESLECFLRFGALGLRATRCMGNFHCVELPSDRSSYENASQLLTKAGFTVKWCPKTFANWKEAVFEAEKHLRTLRKCFNANKVSPLGNSKPRQASAVRFRVVRFTENPYGLVVFEAPHKRVLGPKSQREHPILKDVKLD